MTWLKRITLLLVAVLAIIEIAVLVEILPRDETRSLPPHYGQAMQEICEGKQATAYSIGWILGYNQTALMMRRTDLVMPEPAGANRYRALAAKYHLGRNNEAPDTAP